MPGTRALSIFAAFQLVFVQVGANGDCQNGMCSSDPDEASLIHVKKMEMEKPKRGKKKDFEACPGLFTGTPPGNVEKIPSAQEYDAALQALDLDAVKADLEKLMTDSHACWPADWGHYGPFFVRLAWHCSGTYRNTDNKGGCAGGRIRFDPEASWEDNTNLDKARALLAPIKEKYGIGLSWGDLFVLSGTTALRSMGAPITKFCAGRIDHADGSESEIFLGPSKSQEQDAPCAGPTQGACQTNPEKTKLAPVMVGLIYVNPEGPLDVETGKQNPDPALSAGEIRTTFGKMGHTDKSTVALIGGGHAFGKVHGACGEAHAAGQSPKEAYSTSDYPWVGKCGKTGNGENTWTSGFEGPWTSTPTKWSNEFFKDLLDKEWVKTTSPAGKVQWKIKDAGGDPRIRLTSDMALIFDDKYKEIVEEFAANMTSLDEAFDTAWTGLTTAGGEWSSNKRCDSVIPQQWLRK